MKQESPKRPPLEEGLLLAMKALDNQVAREMQRSPAEREVHGVQKWEPFDKRIEVVTAFLLDALGEQEVDLDSVLILAQAFAKALHLASEDLGADGLGKIRSEYCLRAFQNISNDAHRGTKSVQGEEELM